MDAMPVRARLEQHRARAVAEQNAGGAVGIVDDRRHLVRADHHHLARPPRADELHRDGQRVDEAGTGGLHVEAADVADADHVAQHVGGRRKHEIRRRGGADKKIDVARVGFCPLQEAAHRFRGHVRGAEPLALQDAPLLDAGPLGDPGIAGIDHARELVIGEHVGRQIAVHPGNRRPDRCLRVHGRSGPPAAFLLANSSTISAALRLGTILPICMMPSSRAMASSCRWRSGPLPSSGTSASARLSAVQARCRNSGTDVLAEDEIGEDHRGHPDQRAAPPFPRTAEPCRRRRSARRQAPVRASRCRIWRAPRARRETPPAFPRDR